MERVVVTGVGAVTPIGCDIPSYWDSLKKGRCGVGLITQFDTTEYKVKLAAEVKNFDPLVCIEKRETKHIARYCQMALAASQEAMQEAGLKDGNFEPCRAGVIFGSGVGGLPVVEKEFEKLLERGPGRVSPYCIPMMILNMASALISIKNNFKGESFAPVSACATATHAIGEAFRTIRHGYQDVIIAGGTESSLARSGMAGFMNMRTMYLGTDPLAASIPFDKRRSGFVMGEGSGALVLESMSHAKKRGAKIICELAGYGASSDAYHITSPDPDGDGAKRAMQGALNDANMKPEEIDYINAHGTSTQINDTVETLAIKAAFGEEKAYKLHISSTKSMTGHLLGATGAVEAIAAILAMKYNLIPPTIGYVEPDETCDLDITPNHAVEATVNAAMSNSFGFGGHNATLVFRKVND